MKIRTQSSLSGETTYIYFCPACQSPHAINSTWTFDGNLESPTFSPSIRVSCRVNGADKTTCHHFVRNGQIEYCGDSPHSLSGQTVPLPDLPPQWAS